MDSLNEEFRDLGKFALDSETYLFGDEVADSLKKAKDLRNSVAALKKRTINFSKIGPYKSNKRHKPEPSKNENAAEKPWDRKKKGYQFKNKYQGYGKDQRYKNSKGN